MEPASLAEPFDLFEYLVELRFPPGAFPCRAVTGVLALAHDL
jgi:hypothetical protein